MKESRFLRSLNCVLSRPSLIMTLLLAVLMAGSTLSFFMYSRSAEARKWLAGTEAFQEYPGTWHVLAATYYKLDDNLHTALMLHNKGTRTIEVQPVIYSLIGERREIPAVTIEGNSHHMVNLHEFGIAGTSFQEGSIQVLYRGEYLELGAHLEMMDMERGLIFDEHFAEPATMFSSSRLESVWWLPSRNSEFRLFISNTTGTQLSASVTGTAPGPEEPLTLALSPHETRVLNVRQTQLTKQHSTTLHSR